MQLVLLPTLVLCPQVAIGGQAQNHQGDLMQGASLLLFKNDLQAPVDKSDMDMVASVLGERHVMKQQEA